MRPILFPLFPLFALVFAAMGACDQEPVIDDAAPVVEAQSEPASEPASEQVPDPIAELIPDPLPERVAEPASEPESAPPVAEPSEPVAEAVAQPAAKEPDRRSRSRVIRRFMLEAEGLMPLMETDAAREFLAEVPELPEIQSRLIFVRQGIVPDAVSEAEFQMLPDEFKAALRPQKIDITKYYQTIYGSPLAYARPLDVIAAIAEWDSFNDKKILDFGYGQIGQLRLLAQCGADVTGIELSSLISAMYTLPGDTGKMTGASGNTGSLRLLHGAWPAGQIARERVAGAYDLIMARNVLRKGPMDRANKDVRPELRVHLRTSNEMFLARMNEALKMGAYALVYNIGGAGPELWEQFPASDFSCPFTREQWESAGFELIALNQVDDEPMRKAAKALFLDRGPDGINLETNLYAQYTIAKKVREATIPGAEIETDD